MTTLASSSPTIALSHDEVTSTLLSSLRECSTEISAVLGDTLAVCECRAIGRSLAVEKGQVQAPAKRKEGIEQALADIDEKANWLVSHRVGSNYDVKGSDNVAKLIETLAILKVTSKPATIPVAFFRLGSRKNKPIARITRTSRATRFPPGNVHGYQPVRRGP